MRSWNWSVRLSRVLKLVGAVVEGLVLLDDDAVHRVDQAGDLVAHGIGQPLGDRLAADGGLHRREQVFDRFGVGSIGRAEFVLVKFHLGPFADLDADIRQHAISSHARNHP
jgi:hypothetical protein